MKRVLVLIPFPMSADQRSLREAQLQAVELGPGVAFIFESVAVAPVNYTSASDLALAEIGMIEAGLDAEARGFDAVCIDTMSDSGMAALRSELTIPVIGPGRAAMLTALMLGNRFSIVTMWEEWRHLYTRTLHDLRLEDHCASIRTIGVAPDNRGLLGGREDDVFPLIEAAARACIEQDGAEVIVLGSTTMHQAHGYLAARLPVPVINPGPLSYKLAEALLGLGLSHSAKAHPRSRAPQGETIRTLVAPWREGG
ncbi:MAG: hydrogenase expression protein HupH [Alphaproteobacteria bacterium HGW-Alphaproteobacteria-2]|nr:MAG: hydrogenase expression protein HupH [Alphaproteobacteria bacterium HGW-Alphaproteobacteria-2]